MKCLQLVLISVLVMLVICTGAALAQGASGDSPLPTPTPTVNPIPPDVGDIPTLPDFLDMLAGPTGWVVLGALFSALLAKWPWYNTQPDGVKKFMPIALSIVVASLAQLLLQIVPVEFWGMTADYWLIAAGIVLTWLGSQGWFQAVVKPNRG